MVTEFENLIMMGDNNLESGKTDRAAYLYKEAVELAKREEEPEMEATAHQKAGIAERLLRQWHSSRVHFEEAERLTLKLDDSTSRKLRLGSLYRDTAMLHLDTGDFYKARISILQSTDELEKIRQAREQTVASELELAASIGFTGRVEYITDDNPSKATSLMLTAHNMMHERNDVYERNNLLWLARVSLKHRWSMAGRFYVLSYRSRSYKRMAEYTILLIGGDRLHRLVEKIAGLKT